MFLALKYDFFGKKMKKSQSLLVSTILDIEDLILDTFRYCEKVRDLGFRSIRDTIFSGLVGAPLDDKKMISFSRKLV